MGLLTRQQGKHRATPQEEPDDVKLDTGTLGGSIIRNEGNGADEFSEEEDVDVLDTGGPDQHIDNGGGIKLVSRAEVIRAIVNDSKVRAYLRREPSTMEAADAVDWLASLVQECRDNDYAVVYPTESQMDSLSYDIFDALMPHGAKVYDADSTADLLAKHVLDPTKDETSLWHDTQYDEEDSRDYCSVQVALGVIR